MSDRSPVPSTSFDGLHTAHRTLLSPPHTLGSRCSSISDLTFSTLGANTTEAPPTRHPRPAIAEFIVTPIRFHTSCPIQRHAEYQAILARLCHHVPQALHSNVYPQTPRGTSRCANPGRFLTIGLNRNTSALSCVYRVPPSVTALTQLATTCLSWVYRTTSAFGVVLRWRVWRSRESPRAYSDAHESCMQLTCIRAVGFVAIRDHACVGAIYSCVSKDASGIVASFECGDCCRCSKCRAENTVLVSAALNWQIHLTPSQHCINCTGELYTGNLAGIAETQQHVTRTNASVD